MQNKFQTNNHWLKNRETTDKFPDRVFFSRFSPSGIRRHGPQRWRSPLECSLRMRKFGCSNSSRDSPKS